MKVLITGASRGLGFELVKKFASNKNNEIVAVSRNLARLNELKKICEKEFQNFIHIYSIDFLSNNVEHDFVDLFKEHTSHFDIVINNAGFLINQSFSSTSYSNVLDVYKTNVFAPMLLIKSLIPLLSKEKLCHVVNIGSMGGFQGSAKFSGLSIYSSSKAALANLTECLAEEYKEENIKFNCLALGSVQTDMLASAFPGYVAQVSAMDMAIYVYNFSIQSPIMLNGKVVPLSSSTP